jgi:uncharacterized protein YbjT (DUF2867 family)
MVASQQTNSGDRIDAGVYLNQIVQEKTMKVLMVGATGKYASHVVHELKQRGVTIRALVRDKDKSDRNSIEPDEIVRQIVALTTKKSPDRDFQIAITLNI